MMNTEMRLRPARLRGMTMAALSLLFLTGSAAVSEAGPREGRLFLHINPDVAYTVSPDPSGLSGVPVCGDATFSIEIPDDPVVWYVIAAFPHGETPGLRWTSFGIEYDPDRLAVLDGGFSADQIEIRGDWPNPGSGVRCDWSQEQDGNSIEVGWFIGSVIGGGSTEFHLVPGPFGGFFGGRSYEPIAGFGSLGFGMDGDLTCPTVGTCCFEDGSCASFTENWCDRRDGVYFDSDSCDDCTRVGACCRDWRCRITKEDECTRSNERWLGDGSVCDPDVCIPFGSCCLPDRDCVYIREDVCIERLGQFSPNITCDETDCSILGACCYYGYDVICQLTTEEECLARRAVYNGNETECDPSPCAPGLCCVGPNRNDGCFYTTPEECGTAGGVYRSGSFGPREDACWSWCWADPVEATSWGALKQRFRRWVPDE